MSLLLPLVFALAVAAALLAAGMARWLAAMALLFGTAGYLIGGAPGMPSAPARSPQAEASVRMQIEAARARLLADPADIGAWVLFSDALVRDGRSEEAVEGLRRAVRVMPESADLSAALGTALVAHAEGFITPAARLALGRASALDPEHPGPPYFLGLAHLQAGQPAKALEIWEALAARSPADAPYRADLDRKIAAARMMMAAGVGDPGR